MKLFARFTVLLFLIVGICSSSSARAQTLQLINPSTGTNVVSALPGSTVTFDIVLSGITVTQPLHSFDLTYLLIEPGPTSPPPPIANDFTSNLPSGWTAQTDINNGPFVGQNISGLDLTGDQMLGTLSFVLYDNPNTQVEVVFSSIVSIDPASPLYVFRNGSFLDINNNPLSVSITSPLAHVDVVPEPQIVGLMLMGLLILFGLRSFRWNMARAKAPK